MGRGGRCARPRRGLAGLGSLLEPDKCGAPPRFSAVPANRPSRMRSNEQIYAGRGSTCVVKIANGARSVSTNRVRTRGSRPGRSVDLTASREVETTVFDVPHLPSMFKPRTSKADSRTSKAD